MSRMATNCAGPLVRLLLVGSGSHCPTVDAGPIAVQTTGQLPWVHGGAYIVRFIVHL